MKLAPPDRERVAEERALEEFLISRARDLEARLLLPLPPAPPVRRTPSLPMQQVRTGRASYVHVAANTAHVPISASFEEATPPGSPVAPSFSPTPINNSNMANSASAASRRPPAIQFTSSSTITPRTIALNSVPDEETTASAGSTDTLDDAEFKDTTVVTYAETTSSDSIQLSDDVIDLSDNLNSLGLVRAEGIAPVNDQSRWSPSSDDQQPGEQIVVPPLRPDGATQYPRHIQQDRHVQQDQPRERSVVPLRADGGMQYPRRNPLDQPRECNGAPLRSDGATQYPRRLPPNCTIKRTGRGQPYPGKCSSFRPSSQSQCLDFVSR